jgi:hypothetical protein
VSAFEGREDQVAVTVDTLWELQVHAVWVALFRLYTWNNVTNLLDGIACLNETEN